MIINNTILNIKKEDALVYVHNKYYIKNTKNTFRITKYLEGNWNLSFATHVKERVVLMEFYWMLHNLGIEGKPQILILVLRVIVVSTVIVDWAISLMISSSGFNEILY